MKISHFWMFASLFYSMFYLNLSVIYLFIYLFIIAVVWNKIVFTFSMLDIKICLFFISFRLTKVHVAWSR